MVDKLVRDKIGEELNLEIIPEAEHLHYLKKKVVEEAQEVFDTDNKEDLAEELADLLTVIDVIIGNLGLRDELCKAYIDKYNEKGGFDKMYRLVRSRE